MNKLLKDKKRQAFLLDILTGGAIGAAIFILLFGVSTLNVGYDSWIFKGYIEDDIIQSYAGWLFYRNSPWTFPLGVATNMSMPVGSCVAFMDPDPIYCLILKVFAPILPETFQYFGWHNLINFVLLGISATLLIRYFNVNRIASAVGTILFICAPIFLERAFRHTALGSQYLILFSLLLYFKARREAKFPLGGFFVLCTLAIDIHAYFVPMIYAILLAAILDRVIKNKKYLFTACINLCLCFVGTLGMAYILGLLTRGGGADAGGYGAYNMNLNALFNPSSFNYKSITRKMDWSAFLPMQPQFYRNYEGFNYLGLGVILALCIMLCYFLYSCIIAKKSGNTLFFTNVKKGVIGHLPLIGVCFALLLFAVSNVVNFGEVNLFTIPLPNFIIRFANMFRASGRMLWVMQYLILLSIVLFFARKTKIRHGVIALAIITIIQIVDISPALITKYKYFRNYPIITTDEYQTNEFKFLAQNYDNILCLGNIFDYRFAAGFVANNPDIQTNIILANRGTFEHINTRYIEMQAELVSGAPIQDNTLYICSDYATYATIMSSAHEDIVGYKIGKYYYIGNPVEGCPITEYPLKTEANNG